MGYIPWDEGIASTFLWKEILEQRGYKAGITQLDAGPLYSGVARGDIDFQTDSWLPTTHEDYWNKYGDQLDDLGSWYGPTSLELTVPSYVKGVDSLEDLKGQGKKFDGKIIGIEPSAGMMGTAEQEGAQGVRPGGRVRGRLLQHLLDARRAQTPPSRRRSRSW